MTAEYSLWLMPCAADAVVLREVVDGLAPHFGQPSFVPHVTVQGDLRLPLDPLVAHAKQLAASWSVQPWRVEAVERSAHFFRCLYLRFPNTPVFDGLQRETQTFSGTAEGLSPYPHLSLAYGQVQPHQMGLFENLRVRFTGRPLVFDHLAIYLSSKDIPIADWRCLADFPLTPAAS